MDIITNPGKSVPALLAATLCLSHHATAACNFSAIDAALNNLIAADGVNGGAVIIGSAQGILHETYVGNFIDRNGNTVPYGVKAKVPVASASKLLSGVRILQLRDRGFLDLDTAVSQYLPAPEFAWTGSAAPITLRQMFSHTSGYGNDEDDVFINNPNGTLHDSVVNIASHPLIASQDYLPVPTQFAYGGVSMQIGGQVAQSVSADKPSPFGGLESGDWQADWQHDLGAPMCIASIDWQGLGATQNYHISGGAQSTLEDYARVLAMLLDGGVGNGRRILSPAAIATITSSQTGAAVPGCADGCVPSAEVFALPGGTTYTNTQYSVGAWIEPVVADGGVSIAGEVPTISSIGKFGFAPWVDYHSGTFGILMVYDTAQDAETGQDAASVKSHVAMELVIGAVRAQLAGGSCPATAVYDPIFADSLEASPAAPQCSGVATP